MFYLEENALKLSSRQLKFLKKTYQNQGLLDLSIQSQLNKVCAQQTYCLTHGNAEHINKLDTELMNLYILLMLWAQDEHDLFLRQAELFLKNEKK